VLRRDEVLLAAPYYGRHLTNITLAGGVPVLVPTFESEGLGLDPDGLEAMITNRSKMAALVLPNNPTGSMLGRDAMLRIAEIVERHDLVVASDELVREARLHRGPGDQLRIAAGHAPADDHDQRVLDGAQVVGCLHVDDHSSHACSPEQRR
jgi:bifunctional pyridoxal-dependent enzyme with beta-cystathionase and maltose regulon repressor activities